MKLYANSVFRFAKKKPTSNIFRYSFILKHHLLLNKKVKQITTGEAWKSGRSCSGRRTVLSKGRLCPSRPAELYSYKPVGSSLHFFYSHYFSKDFNKSSNLVVSSLGSAFHKRFISQENLFTFRLGGVLSLQHNLLGTIMPKLGLVNFVFATMSYTVFSLPVISNVINIKTPADSKAKYSRSLGSNSILIRKLTNLGHSVVKLPSGVRKIVPIVSLCEIVSPMDRSLLNKKLSPPKVLRTLGKAPRSRGVAKNPVDHPHGGRSKSIKYPRTPWGKTTKYK